MEIKQVKVRVSFDNLWQRYWRRVREQSELLRKSKRKDEREVLGEWYTIQRDTDQVLRTNVDPEQFFREKGVLRPWEYLGDVNGEKQGE